MLDAEVHHTIRSMAPVLDYRSVVAFFARQLMKDLRLVGGYDVLYPGKMKTFMQCICCSSRLPVHLEDRWYCATCPNQRSRQDCLRYL